MRYHIMKKSTKIATIIAMLTARTAAATYGTLTKESNDYVFYNQLAEKMNTVEVYDSADLTEEVLKHRDGKIIIEKMIGEVTNEKTGEGKLLNNPAPDYNPDTNSTDDVIARYDYIIDGKGD